MTPMLAPWMAEVVLISWRTVRKEKRPPFPSELLATFVVFGTVSLVAEKQPQIASLFGWGVVVATFLNLFPEGYVPSGKPFGAYDPRPSNTQGPTLYQPQQPRAV